MCYPLRMLASVFALLLLPVGAVTAQSFAVDRGAWQLGGSASYSSSRAASDTARTTAIYLSPQVGYFVRRGVLVGAVIPFSRYASPGSVATTYGIGPQVGYYFGSRARTFYPFLSARATLQWTRATFGTSFDSLGGGEEITYRTQAYEASGGVAAMLSRDVALTGEAYYASFHYRTQPSWTEGNTGTSNAFGARFGLSVFLQ